MLFVALAVAALGTIGWMVFGPDGGAGSGPADQGPPVASGEPEPASPEDPASSAAEEQSPTPQPSAPRENRLVTVDLEQHFPGLVDAFGSENSDRYGIDFFEYDALQGKRLRESELETWQAKWRSAQTTAANLSVAAPEALPGNEPGGTPGIEAVIAAHPYLGPRFRSAGDGYEESREFAPYLLLIQHPPGQESETSVLESARLQAQKYGRNLRGLERLWREQYADPGGLELRPSFEMYALVMLAGESEYLAYKGEAGTDLRHSRAHFDPQLELGITYLEPGFEVETDNLHASIHEMVHALQYFWFAGSGMPSATWFSEGFAEYLSYEQQVQVRRADKRDEERTKIVREAVGILAQRVGASPELVACIVPLEVLAEIRGYGHASFLFGERALQNGYEGTFAEQDAMLFLYKQAYLVMHFLHHGAEGRYRPAVVEFITEVMKGVPSETALRQALAEVDTEQLNADYLAFLGEHGLSVLLEDIRAGW